MRSASSSLQGSCCAAEHEHEEEDEDEEGEPELTPQEMSALRRQFAKSGVQLGPDDEDDEGDEDDEYEFGMPGGLLWEIYWP